jgi:hypothetical protein
VCDSRVDLYESRPESVLSFSPMVSESIKEHGCEKLGTGIRNIRVILKGDGDVTLKILAIAVNDGGSDDGRATGGRDGRRVRGGTHEFEGSAMKVKGWTFHLT